MNDHQESTYSLLVRSEEKNRSVLETVVYTTIILSVLVAIWQFAHQPVQIPTDDTGIVGVSEVANSPS